MVKSKEVVLGGLRLVKVDEVPLQPRVVVIMRVVDADNVVREEEVSSAALPWTDEGQVDWSKLDAEQTEACLRQVSGSYASAIRTALGLAPSVASPGISSAASRLMRKTHKHLILK